MSYLRDRDAYTRGSGAIAAADLGNPRRAAQRAARLRASSVRDAYRSQFVYGERGGMGAAAVTATGLTGGKRRPTLDKGGGTVEGGTWQGPLLEGGRLPVRGKTPAPIVKPDPFALPQHEMRLVTATKGNGTTKPLAPTPVVFAPAEVKFASPAPTFAPAEVKFASPAPTFAPAEVKLYTAATPTSSDPRFYSRTGTPGGERRGPVGGRSTPTKVIVVPGPVPVPVTPSAGGGGGGGGLVRATTSAATPVSPTGRPMTFDPLTPVDDPARSNMRWLLWAAAGVGAIYLFTRKKKDKKP